MNTETLNITDIRRCFPILGRTINGKPLVYFDNAASNQKPQSVLDAMTHYYQNDYSNIHRGVHSLSQIGTEQYEAVRDKVQGFIGAQKREEIIFTKGTTESINLVAHCFGQQFLKAGDQVLVSQLEHHSNIVPWQLACQRAGAELVVIPITISGELILEAYEALLNPRVKMVAISHISNTLGTINPIKQVIELAHQHNIPVLIDGAQAIAHTPIDVQLLEADFYVFSAHKLFGPTGVGILYGKASWLNQMPPYQGGGDMINTVSFKHTTYNDLPFKFEAGTPNIAGVIGLGAALDFVNSVGLDVIGSAEEALLHYATEQLQALEYVQIIGTAAQKSAVISFVVKGCHPYDIGTLLNEQGIAVRTGHHCTQPLMEFYNISGTIRASFSVYNTKSEIDVFIQALQKAYRMIA